MPVIALRNQIEQRNRCPFHATLGSIFSKIGGRSCEYS